jgi:hypothetical protein
MKKKLDEDEFGLFSDGNEVNPIDLIDPGFIETFNLNNSVNRKKESYNPKKQIKVISFKGGLP